MTIAKSRSFVYTWPAWLDKRWPETGNAVFYNAMMLYATRGYAQHKSYQQTTWNNLGLQVPGTHMVRVDGVTLEASFSVWRHTAGLMAWGPIGLLVVLTSRSSTRRIGWSSSACAGKGGVGVKALRLASIVLKRHRHAYESVAASIESH